MAEPTLLLHRDKEEIPPKAAAEINANPIDNKIHDTHERLDLGSTADNKSHLHSYRHVFHNTHTYHPASGSSDQLMSMQFMHKPKRSSSLLEKSVDPTRANSIWNSKSHVPGDREESSDATSQSPEPANSPIHTDTPDEIVDEEVPTPQTIGYKLVRKKSGELVKPSLKEPGYFDSNVKRSKSLPTTPTYKLVHFGGDNHVRYFKKRDVPSAISASNSPALDGIDALLQEVQLDDDDDDNDDEEFRLGPAPQFNLNPSAITKYPNPHHQPLIEWELKLLNFGNISYDKKIHQQASPVFLERVFISVDRKYLLGHIAVKNINFEKHVTIRYTLDDWCTIIEIPTTYSPDRPNVLKQNDYDRFTFKVSLENLFNSFRIRDNNDSSLKEQENKYSLCVRYTTDDKEFWDNNNTMNYDLKLTKKLKNQSTSKIQEHSKRPRYSSSYLKRRLSDSKLEVTSPQLESSTNSFYQNDNSSSDVNDFVKNDFYMSSPMFTSLSSHSENRFKHSPDSLFSPPINTHTSQSPLPQPAPMFLKSDSDSHERFTGQAGSSLLDSKSYRDFLENYCFFSSKDQDGTSESNTEKGSGSPTFTVSSLLGT